MRSGCQELVSSFRDEARSLLQVSWCSGLCYSQTLYRLLRSEMPQDLKGFTSMQSFLWLANWPALDFVNTQIVQSGALVDLFRTGKDVAEWLRVAGVSEIARDHSAEFDRQLLGAARDYRRRLRGGLEKLVLTGDVPAVTISATNHLLEQGRLFTKLRRAKGELRLEKRWNFASAADHMIPVAASFAELLTTATLSRIRRCKNPECVLLFYDASKSGTRTWCSLDNCGNKLRVAAFRQRHLHP